MESIRQQKVAGQIRDELSRLIREDVDESRSALVTITDVHLSPDLRHAKVFVSIFPESADRGRILAALARARGRLRHDLGAAIRLRHVPELEFRIDTTLERGERIDRLLRGETPPGDDGA